MTMTCVLCVAFTFFVGSLLAFALSERSGISIVVQEPGAHRPTWR